MNYSCQYTEYGSDYYLQARALRERVFYFPVGLTADAVLDDSETRSAHIVAIDQETGQVVGSVSLNTDNEAAQIIGLVVVEDLRKHGVASALIRLLFQKAQSLGFSRVWLNARVTAVGFYKKHGFITIGEEFPSRLTGVPTIRMECDLSA
ncbi:MAG: GNAT family N-acetyltransferase [Solirubrobacterales bacterium]